MLLLLFPLQTLAAESIHPTRVLVKASPDTVLRPGDRLLEDAVVTRPLTVPNWYIVTVSDHPEHYLADLMSDPRIALAETDPVLIPERYDTDPSFPEQWGLENLPSRGGHYDADIDVRDAWDQGATGEGVVVAIIDSGLDLNHPALVDSYWVNPGEIPDNGVDDDNNGYVDDVHGMSFVDPTGDIEDHDGHGTSCAGLIAAASDGISTVGIAPAARIMGVQIFGEEDVDGFGSVAAEAIIYAADMGADVLSNSWRYGKKERRAVTEAIEYAAAKGAIFVVSAGNIPLDTDEGGYYPANSPVPEVVTVAASTRFDEIVEFPGIWASAYGLETVEVAAPGDGTLTTIPGGGYSDFSGTSASAPFVSGAVALMWSVAPSLSPLAVKDILVETADPLGMPVISDGRLNAGSAVRRALGGPLPRTLSITHPPLRLQEETPLTVHGAEPDAEVTWYFPDTQTFDTGRQVVHTFVEGGPWTVVVETRDPDGTPGQTRLQTDLPITWEDAGIDPFESLHDVVPNLGAWVIDTQEAPWTRVHFTRISFRSTGWKKQDALAAIFDADGLVVWSFEGEAEDLWTPPLKNGPFTLVWEVESDQAGSSWGFELDRVERSIVPPAPVTSITEPPPPASITGGRTCTTGPIPSSLLLRLLGRRT